MVPFGNTGQFRRERHPESVMVNERTVSGCPQRFRHTAPMKIVH
jgi:hypothetical protein